MLRSMFAASLLTIGIAGAAQAMPVCYMEMHGVMTDLTHMCGNGDVFSEDESISSITGSSGQARLQDVIGESEVLQEGVSAFPRLIDGQVYVDVFNRFTSGKIIVSEVTVKLTSSTGAALHTVKIDIDDETLHAQESETYTRRISESLARQTAGIEMTGVDAFVNPF